MYNTDYFYLFETLLYAVVLIHIIRNWNEMIRSYGSFEPHWTHIGLSILLFFALIQSYLSGKSVQNYGEITSSITFFAYLILNPLLLITVSFQLFPKDYEGTNLQEYLLDNIWKIIIPISLWGFVLATRNVLFYIENTTTWSLAELTIPHFILILFAIYMAIIRSPKLLAGFVIMLGVAAGYFFWLS